ILADKHYLGFILETNKNSIIMMLMKKTISTQQYFALIKWLVAARKEQGLTVRQLGEMIDETHQIVSKIERCQRKLDVYEFVQYCEALNLNPEDGLKYLK
ncbi:MAG: helix-turn-helix transcriptional regulator, partial [Pseudomonadota bacterium]|nr:helix-turn-helix transcriptional regulator [Pseudomonadota bacterium]